MKRNPAQVAVGELLDAGVAVAVEEGLHAVSAVTVATKAGTTPKVVLHHRPDMPAFVAEVFRTIAGTELAAVKREVLAHPTPAGQLAVLLETLALPARTDVDAVWAESWGLGRRNPALGEAVRAEEGAWHTFVVAVIRRGVRSGDFLPADPETVAHLLLAVIDGVNAYSLVGYHSGVDRLRLLRAVVRSELGVADDETAPVAQD